ncbi:MAG TPA: hypothetical protein VGF06_09055 [Terriglobales bacterium]|jgi:hypothetical protein
MPVVRIITRLSAYPAKLVRELRARGFEVETRVSSPEAPSVAELEVTLQQCAPEELATLLADPEKRKDVYIVAGCGAHTGPVRSVGMVVLTAPDAESQDSTVIPAPVAEMYGALLQQRNAGVTHSRRYRNLRGTRLDWSKVNAAVAMARRKAAGLAADLQKSSRLRRANAHAGWARLGQIAMAMLAEAAHETALLGRRTRAALARFFFAPRETRGPRPQAAQDYDLVPTMFNLSSEEARGEELQVRTSQPVPEPAVPRLRPVRIVAAVASLGLAVGAVVLLLHLFGNSHGAPVPPALEKAATHTGAMSQPRAGLQVKDAVVKADVDLAMASHTPTKKEAADDYFDEVVVHHFPNDSARQVPDNQKNGIKRRVVVD